MIETSYGNMDFLLKKKNGKYIHICFKTIHQAKQFAIENMDLLGIDEKSILTMEQCTQDQLTAFFKGECVIKRSRRGRPVRKPSYDDDLLLLDD